jgi:hypothetical protein
MLKFLEIERGKFINPRQVNEEHGTNWNCLDDLGKQFKHYTLLCSARYHGEDGQFDERPGQESILSEFVVTEDNEIQQTYIADLEARIETLEQTIVAMHDRHDANKVELVRQRVIMQDEWQAENDRAIELAINIEELSDV